MVVFNGIRYMKLPNFLSTDAYKSCIKLNLIKKPRKFRGFSLLYELKAYCFCTTVLAGLKMPSVPVICTISN